MTGDRLLPKAVRLPPSRVEMPRQTPDVWLREAALGDDFFAYIGVPGSFQDGPAVVERYPAVFFDTGTRIALDAAGTAIDANLPTSADEPRVAELIGQMRDQIGAGLVGEPGEPGPFALLASPRHDNYYHFLFDDLARLGFYGAVDTVADDASFPVPPPKPWQRELYQLAGIEPRLLPLPKGIVVLRDVWIAPRGLARIAEFRSRGWDRVRALIDRVPDDGRRGPSRIYVTRQGTRHRRLRNEVEVRAFVEAHGFATVHPETMPVAEQIRLFQGADVVLGVFGAGLTNAAFMRPGTLLLEIAPSKTAALPGVHNAIFSSIAGLRDLRYGLLSAPGSGVDETTHDFSVPVDRLEDLVEQTAVL